MPKPRPTEQSAPKVPTYLRHRSGSRDRAFCYLYDAEGNRRRVYVGPWNSPESKRRFRDIVGRSLLAEEPPESTTGAITVEEVVACFLSWKKTQVVDSEWQRLRYSAKPLLELYRDESAADFGPKKLRRVRDAMVASGTLCRLEINRRMIKIRSMFKWAASEELVPVSIHEALRTLPALRRGRTTARESNPVLPVPEPDIKKALRCMTPTVATMVRLQLACGARPGEVLAMKCSDIDRDGPHGTWIYAPDSHKNAWRGQARRIPLGQRAQELLTPYLDADDPDAVVFTPRRSEDERRFLRRQDRRTPMTPSQRERDQRRREDPRRNLTSCWTTTTYRHAVHYACKAAGVNPWSPGRLRHNFEAAVERRFGIEVASKALGHADIGTTQHYRDRRDLSVAVEVAKAIG